MNSGACFGTGMLNTATAAKPLPRLALALLILTQTVGCVAREIGMPDHERLALSGQRTEIRAVHYPPTAFSVSTAEHRIGGASIPILGLVLLPFMILEAVTLAARDASTASQTQKKYALADPVLMVKEGFISGLTQDLPGVSVQAVPEPLARDVLKPGAASEAGTVIDFKTRRWYVSVQDFRHRIGYDGEARLLRPSASTIVWLGRCSVGREVDWKVTADGNPLKHAFDDAAHDCAGQLLDQFFDRVTCAQWSGPFCERRIPKGDP